MFLHFISFRDRVWPSVQRDCFGEGLIKRESRSICQVMFDRLITGGSIKKRSGLRWLTRQLKPLCSDLGSYPSLGWPFPSAGLLKSSIMRNFILLLNVGYMLFWGPQKWSEFGQIGPWTERAQSLLSSAIIAFHWFGRKRVTGRVLNAGVLSRVVPTLGKIKYSNCFLCQRRQLKHIPLQTRSWF